MKTLSNTDFFMNRKIKIIGLIALIVIVVSIILVTYKSKKEIYTGKIVKEQTQVDNMKSGEEEALKILQEMEDQENPQSIGPITVEIVSPEEETFLQGQARMYSAKITNLTRTMSKSYVCNWKFYLNQYSEETLYEEKEIAAGSDRCAFTSTFIEDRGNLRVVVELIISDYNTKEVLETYTAERNYIVK